MKPRVTANLFRHMKDNCAAKTLDILQRQFVSSGASDDMAAHIVKKHGANLRARFASIDDDVNDLVDIVDTEADMQGSEADVARITNTLMMRYREEVFSYQQTLAAAQPAS